MMAFDDLVAAARSAVASRQRVTPLKELREKTSSAPAARDVASVLRAPGRVVSVIAEVKLKGRQYDVLEFLVSRKGQLVSKSQIFDRVWGFMSDTSTNVVEVYVSAVRKQLKPFGYDVYLQTVRGAGYLFGEGGA